MISKHIIKLIQLVLLSYISVFNANAQYILSKSTDTTTLQSALRKSHVEARFRLYLMGTDNAHSLTDYHALAFGGGLKFETGSYKGFRIGVSGFFIWNLGSSDLTKPDSVTQVKNRYEIGQFDVENPANRNDMDRIEDFYLRYEKKGLKITYGKQEIQTPFLNPQDGRMRPTSEQGLWVQYTSNDKFDIETGWLYRISPRGTVRWFGIDESIGIYPSGVNVFGSKSNYRQNLKSSGVGILGIRFKPNPSLTIQFWDHYVDRIFNTSMMQADGEWNIGEEEKLIGGLQYVFQHPLKDGGNPDPLMTYFDKRDRAQIFSMRTGVRKRETIIQINATRITADGRFLMPREWGREPFYTFMPRERNEGAGDVKAVSFNFIRQFPQKNIRFECGYGYYDMPDVRDSRFNKYQMPSYQQFLMNIRYKFTGFLTGLNAEILYVYKKNSAETYGDFRYVINKVDMQHLDLILNYKL